MEKAFCSEEMRTRITNIIEDVNFSNHGQHGVVRLAPELSDLFVTQYSVGDFLTPHNDGAGGSWAFVVSLMDSPGEEEWNADDFGGTLRFECPRNHVKFRQQNGMRRPYQWCESLSPSFNSLLLFRTYSSDGKKITTGPLHEVLPVKWKAAVEGFHRFGVTGWYMDMTDDMPDRFRTERDKMRAK
jgi:Rps23 Pro-64 3,4-dihydroxylase Tpa1-like proline 4-hydroxylase